MEHVPEEVQLWQNLEISQPFLNKHFSLRDKNANSKIILFLGTLQKFISNTWTGTRKCPFSCFPLQAVLVLEQMNDLNTFKYFLNIHNIKECIICLGLMQFSLRGGDTCPLINDWGWCKNCNSKQAVTTSLFLFLSNQ